MSTSSTNISTLFLDIGGVLLTNGWDREARVKAAGQFNLDHDEMNERHHLTFDTYEEGKLTLDAYLDRVIFYRDRDFSREEFKKFMFAQSRDYPDMIGLIHAIKERYGLNVVAVSNEGRELTVHRIEKFQLCEIIDVFISSCFTHFRKPDPDIFQLALDAVQVRPENVLYIDDREMFVEVAHGYGLESIWHRDFEDTRIALVEYGLIIDDEELQARIDQRLACQLA